MSCKNCMKHRPPCDSPADYGKYKEFTRYP
jgi:hypothetical protein